MKTTKLMAVPLALLLVACDDDDNHFPDPVVGSSKVASADVHMDVYAESDSDGTELTVYFHRHHSSGFGQYLQLTGSDELTVVSGAETSLIEEDLSTSHGDVLMAHYHASVAENQAAATVDVSFVRDGQTLIPATATLLEESVFNVTADSDPVTHQSTLQAEWTAIEGYDYQLKFAFSCMSGGESVGFTRTYPNASTDLISPFSLDIAQFSPPPTGATDCEVTVTLRSRVDQSEAQTADDEVLQVLSIREQEQVLIISNEIPQ